MRRTSLTVAAMALAVMVAGCTGNEPEAVETTTTTTTVQESEPSGSMRVAMDLTGSAEAPSPGDPDGRGSASLELDPIKAEVCFDVSVQRLDTPTGMHIHEGGTGKAGDIVVRLTAPTSGDGDAKGCTKAERAVLGRIIANPDGFYLNVHTGPFPEGAVRGQLARRV